MNITLEKKVTIEKSFTTNDKGYRKHSVFISGRRCNQFMLHLEERGIKDVASYKTLRYEFIQCFQSNDFRTITKYLGHPQFRTIVSHRRRRAFPVLVKKKTGLLESLGYITQIENPSTAPLSKDAYFMLNWEKVQRINACVSRGGREEREERERERLLLPTPLHTHKYSLEKDLSPHEKMILKAAKKEAST